MPQAFDAAPATDVATVTLKPSTLTPRIEDARRQRERTAAARETGDWHTEIADATSCFEQVAFALDEIATRLGPRLRGRDTLRRSRSRQLAVAPSTDARKSGVVTMWPARLPMSWASRTVRGS